jgi:hypothetical protein
MLLLLLKLGRCCCWCPQESCLESEVKCCWLKKTVLGLRRVWKGFLDFDELSVIDLINKTCYGSELDSNCLPASFNFLLLEPRLSPLVICSWPSRWSFSKGKNPLGRQEAYFLSRLRLSNCCEAYVIWFNFLFFVEILPPMFSGWDCWVWRLLLLRLRSLFIFELSLYFELRINLLLINWQTKQT